MNTATILWYGFQCFATFFILGAAYAIIEIENDDEDDDDLGGGTLQPCHVTNR